MAKYVGYKRPKDTKKTVKHLLSYLGHYKWAFLLIAILVFISAGAGIMGTFLIKPVVNNFIVPGNMKGLIIAVCGMGVMYACGALSTLGYNRLMVHTSQKVVSEIRMDLFKHTQKLPLKYFDNNTHGEIMSHFTNDVDTVQEAMNNSFARAYILPGMKSMETPLTAVIFIYFLVTFLHCSIIKSLHILFVIILNEINNLIFRKPKACHSGNESLNHFTGKFCL